MIQIGVFSHEFGHAFGLPDLYDSVKPQDSSGIGTWGLMASGSWGGDNKHPEFPSHLSAWAKEYLGWIDVTNVTSDKKGLKLKPIITSGEAIRIDYSNATDPSDTKYLLVEYRKKTGFDKKIFAEGLLVTEVNNEKIQSGLVSNSVNGSPFDMGLNVVEADGNRDLDNGNNRGDSGDVFPGESKKVSLDASHPENIKAAICDITLDGSTARFDVYVSRASCPGQLAGSAVSPAIVIEDGCCWRCRYNCRRYTGKCRHKFLHPIGTSSFVGGMVLQSQ